MNTYRVYLLNTADVAAPTVEQVFVQSEKYNTAWPLARAILAGKEDAKGKSLFVDAECKTAWKAPKAGVDHLTVAKLLDCTPRNKKLDKATLADILADASLTEAEKLTKIQALSA